MTELNILGVGVGVAAGTALFIAHEQEMFPGYGVVVSNTLGVNQLILAGMASGALLGGLMLKNPFLICVGLGMYIGYFVGFMIEKSQGVE